MHFLLLDWPIITNLSFTLTWVSAVLPTQPPFSLAPASNIHLEFPAIPSHFFYPQKASCFINQELELLQYPPLPTASFSLL